MDRQKLADYTEISDLLNDAKLPSAIHCSLYRYNEKCKMTVHMSEIHDL